MRFADYLASIGKSQDAAAVDLGITQGRVSHLVRGARPGPALIERIRIWSGNRVMPNDWFPSGNEVVAVETTAGAAQ